MKAKVGNKVVNVIPDDGRFLDLSDMTYYDAADLSFDFDDDWQAFRREAAKDAMCAILSNSKMVDERSWDYVISVVKNAVGYADELIRQLTED